MDTWCCLVGNWSAPANSIDLSSECAFKLKDFCGAFSWGLLLLLLFLAIMAAAIYHHHGVLRLWCRGCIHMFQLPSRACGGSIWSSSIHSQGHLGSLSGGVNGHNGESHPLLAHRFHGLYNFHSP